MVFFEFTASQHFDFITRFAGQVKVPVRDNLLEIPSKMGEGYIRKVAFGNDFRLLIHHYTLKEDLIIKRNPAIEPSSLISIFFYNNKQDIDLNYNNEGNMSFLQKNSSAIQITTNDRSSTIRFPANSYTQYMVVGITALKLQSLLAIDQPNSTIETVTKENGSFLFFESMNAETKLLLKNISAVNMSDALSHFYVQIKVQELLYLLFSKLSLRENAIHRKINRADVENILAVRNEILSDLSVSPVLSELTSIAAMSETKLKVLFKRTFGDTIYNYYQKVRMEEAAFLLKQVKLSVSQVGYELGFSNLSHFSRLFEKHYGTTPKKFTYT